MEWTGEGIVVGVRTHGETSVILEVFTPDRGRHLGMVLGGRSRRMRPVLQAGNSVAVTWRARLEEHMGQFTAEPVVLRAADLMASATALHGLGHLCALVRLLPERDPHCDLYAEFVTLIEILGTGRDSPSDIVRFELRLLAELGFGLDLTRCAATGQRHDLAFVSPKSGRAVSREAGEPYRDRLLRLPAFLTDEGDAGNATATEVRAAFDLTGFFLVRDVFAARGSAIPDARRAYLAAALPFDAEQTARSAVRLTP